MAGGAAGGREKRGCAIFPTHPVTEGHYGLAGAASLGERSFELTKKKRASFFVRGPLPGGKLKAAWTGGS